MTTQRDLTMRGLGLPALQTAGGYFTSKTAYDVAWGDLMYCLFTPIGTRPGLRGFGSAIPLQLYEFASDVTDRAEFLVRDAAEKDCPHIVIDSVIVSSDETTVSLDISFHLRSDSANDTVSRRVVLDRNSIIAALKEI